MTALLWDEVGERVFESGISKGVFYDSAGYGVSWNGLTSVEVNTPVEVQPIYFDGLKFNDFVTFGNFAGVMRAFTYPDEFLPYEGFLQDQQGFYVANQPTGRFGLSYRTNIGNDIDQNIGYKLHVLYNITAAPTQRNFQTVTDTIEAIAFEWDISAIPEYIEGFRPTAHIIFDSRELDPWLLADIEEILYGDEDSDAYLPSLKSLSTFVRKWDRLIITDNNDGTWTASSMQEGQIVMTDPETFEITADTAEYLDPDTFNIWSSEKNEEDIWLP